METIYREVKYSELCGVQKQFTLYIEDFEEQINDSHNLDKTSEHGFAYKVIKAKTCNEIILRSGGKLFEGETYLFHIPPESLRNAIRFCTQRPECMSDGPVLVTISYAKRKAFTITSVEYE
jgi:hypothetical protein